MTHCAGTRKNLKLGEMLATLPTPPTFHFPPCNYALIQAQVDQHRCWGHCHLILERAQNKRLWQCYGTWVTWSVSGSARTSKVLGTKSECKVS